MIGGKVIEVLAVGDEKLWIDCKDKNDTCAIHVESDEKSQKISVGDSLWWQGGAAYWTPKENAISEEDARKRNLRIGVDYEIALRRIGFSGVKRPDPVTA